MSLRITQSMVNSKMLSNLFANSNRLNELQLQASSGKVLNRPSDDPIALTFAMRYRSEMTDNEQYERNINTANSTLEFTDTTLSEVIDTTQRVRELMVQGASGSASDSSLKAIATEMKQLFSQFIDLGNSSFNGKSVFNGQSTLDKTYPDTSYDEAMSVTPHLPLAQNVTPDNTDVKLELSLNVTMKINTSAAKVFGDAVVPGLESESTNIFQVMTETIQALESGNSSAVSSLLGRLDQRMDKMLEQRSDVGARMNRLEYITSVFEASNLNLETMQSRVEDADLAEVLMNLKMQENAYQASLSAGAQMIRPSLVDFLK